MALISGNNGGLVIEGVNKRFGAVQPLQDVNPEVRSGELHPQVTVLEATNGMTRDGAN